MVPRSKKRKAGSSDDGHSKGDGLFAPQELAKKPRGKKAAVGYLDEYKEDAGREGSRRFFQAANLQEQMRGKRKEAMPFQEKFEAKVEQTQEELHQYLKQCEEDLSKADAQELERLQEACPDMAALGKAHLKHYSVKPTSTIPKKEDHPLFQAGQEILKICHSILGRHKKTDAESRGRKLSLPTEQWKRDGEGLQKVLDFGRQHARGLIDSIVIPDLEVEARALDQGSNATSESEAIAADIFAESRKRLSAGKPWGQTAMSIVRGCDVLLTGIETPTTSP